jgi:UDP-N-acetylmuramyl-tripeptide synthetase
MQLKQLLEGSFDGRINNPCADWEIAALCCDSRKAQPGSLFFALPGLNANGEKFIDEAIHKGSRIVVKKASTPDISVKDNICYIQTPHLHELFKKLVQRFYQNPSGNVNTIGVTGTNGKTTITFLFESVLKQAGQECGVVGTVQYKLGSHNVPSTNTTPGLLDNQQILSDLSHKGIKYCVMEVSSHGLDQGRVDLIDFTVAVFTNLTSDHLDYHKTREEYFLAKAKLFEQLSSKAVAVINADDPYGQQLCSMTKANVITYGIHQSADVRARDIQLSPDGSKFTVQIPNGSLTMTTPLAGVHNVYNILGVIGGCLFLNIDREAIRRGIEQLNSVPGRLQRIDAGQDYSVYIDYAHTEDALDNVLRFLREIASANIILVFGCGGDRDKTKRPRMGKVAGEKADICFVTSDNPRSEDPQSIIDQIVQGFTRKNYTIIADRQEAIRQALSKACKDDIVLIAGKGHESYQIFNNKTIPFNEEHIVRQFLNVHHC